jgi:hypothetical protein
MSAPKKHHPFPSMVGTSSLLVVFSSICLTIFAVLTVSTANAEARLSDASSEAVCQYYAADCMAETIFAEIRQGNIPEGVTVENNLYSYSCPISQTLKLHVKLHFSENQWTVLQWQAISDNR